MHLVSMSRRGMCLALLAVVVVDMVFLVVVLAQVVAVMVVLLTVEMVLQEAWE